MTNINKMVEQMIQNQEEMKKEHEQIKQDSIDIKKTLDYLIILNKQQGKDIESIKNIILKYEDEEDEKLKVVK